ncbi:MAG: L-idonate 5-dehydrogenase [Pseudomonadota bacterium]
MTAIVAHGPKDLRLETRDDDLVGVGQVRVHMARGGICGSDLHYYRHGGFGTVRLKEPMILGHEVAGHISEIGSEVIGLSVGDLVAVSPSRPNWQSAQSQAGRPNHCEDMRFYGSAMPFPHIQGAFRTSLVADASQCALATGLSPAEAAMAEPLAVTLHAADQAGSLLGKRVLITGCGPIGLLCLLVARRNGAAEVVVTDIAPFPLQTALDNGADQTLNVAETPDAMDVFTANKGHFDVLFECSGVAAALTSAVPAMRPQGVIVQLGLGGDMVLPVQAMTAKELTFRGSFRFHWEFHQGVELMRKGLIDTKPLITHTLPLAKAVEAFDLAGDRSQAIKAQIAFKD